MRTILLMWGLRLAYALGVPPLRLARFYHCRGVRAVDPQARERVVPRGRRGPGACT